MLLNVGFLRGLKAFNDCNESEVKGDIVAFKIGGLVKELLARND